MTISIGKILKNLRNRALKILSRQDALPANARHVSLLILIFLIIYIFSWQFQIGLSDRFSGDYYKYGIHHSCGASFSDPEHFFSYGIYYWGLFPAFPDRDALPRKFDHDSWFYSKDGAMEILDKHGYALRMDINGTFRMGNVMNLWLPALSAVFKGTVRDVNFIPFNAAYFILSLLVILCAFWIYGRGLMGLVLVLVLGSYQFQLYSAHMQDNIFSYMISTMIIATGLFMPLIFDVKIKSRTLYILCVLNGAWIGIAHLMRADCLSAFLPSVLVILIYKHVDYKQKAGMVIAFFFAYYAVSSIFQSFFDYKYNEAFGIVKEKGGNTFKGHRLKNHMFWHTIWCGMHDFDEKYKHNWSDFVAEYNAKKMLKKRYGIDVGKLTYHHKPVDYYLPSRVPEYDSAMRDLVFEDIGKDPVWYLDILFKRLKRIFLESIRPRIMLITGHALHIPGGVFVYILTVSLILFFRLWGHLKLIIFSAGSMTIPLFVTTFTNYHHYSIVHLVTASVFLHIVLKIAAHYLGQLVRK